MKSSSLSPSLAGQIVPGVSSRYDFKLEASKTALLVIDIQDYLSIAPITSIEDDTSEYLFKSSLPKAIANIVRLVSKIRKIRDCTLEESDTDRISCSHLPEIIFTFVQSQTKDSRDISLDYKLSGSKLSANLPNSLHPASFTSLPLELQPSTSNGRGDILIPKTSCSVFQSTNISYMLRNLNKEQLIVCGQLTNQCVESTVRDAADLGYFVTVAEDACAANSFQNHNQGISGMKGYSRILSTDTILQELICYQDNDLTITQMTPSTIPVVPTAAPSSSPSVQQSTSDAISALLYTLDYAGIEFLRFAVVDLSNILRTKAVPIARLLKSTTNSSSSVHFNLHYMVTMAQVSVGGFPQYGDVILPETQLNAKKVLTLHPDLSTLRILPYAKKSAMVLCSLWDRNTISPFCTRNILSKVVQQAKAEFNIGFSVGVELEFCLFHRPDASIFSGANTLEPSPVDYSLFCQPTILNQEEEFISEVCNALSKQRIFVDLVHAESAHGQLELVLPYEKDPLLLADNVVFARETIMEVAKKKNMSVLFLPKVYDKQAGNGMHLHFSVWDTHSGENIFPSSHPGEITALGQSFMEGILLHMPALLSFTNPTRNSFLRIGKGCWTGSNCSWDVEDKEVPLRVCLDAESGLATNVEYKLSDSTANVYLQIASLLCSGLDGIRRNLQLRPAQSTSLLSHSSIHLPSNLLESLVLISNDECLSQLLGSQMLTSYLAAKRADVSKAGDLSQDFIDALKRSF